MGANYHSQPLSKRLLWTSPYQAIYKSWKSHLQAINKFSTENARTRKKTSRKPEGKYENKDLETCIQNSLLCFICVDLLCFLFWDIWNVLITKRCYLSLWSITQDLVTNHYCSLYIIMFGIFLIDTSTHLVLSAQGMFEVLYWHWVGWSLTLTRRAL